ncbi:MAG: hypothetical protein ACKVZ0_14395 [Gemmatimonadales bacterium]
MRLTIVLATAALLAGCSTTENPLGNTEQPTLPTPLIVNQAGNGIANLEEFEVCKYGSSATVDYSIVDHTNGNTVTPGTLNLADGECQVIGVFGGAGATITATEVAVQAGFQLNRVDVTIVTPGPVYTTSTGAGPSATELVKGGAGIRGALVEFYNGRIPTGGGEGCTPGYWKQPHHFDSWPAPYAPGDLFSAYFEDAFPGKTLLQVLSTGGGKLIALGRHTVAALLNSASAGVDYDLTTAQVVSEFNNVYPSSNYGPQKDRFAGFNELGCPLN